MAGVIEISDFKLTTELPFKKEKLVTKNSYHLCSVYCGCEEGIVLSTLYIRTHLILKLGFPVGSVGKESICMQETQETWVWSLGQKDPLEEGMATHPSILALRIPWTEELGGL